MIEGISKRLRRWLGIRTNTHIEQQHERVVEELEGLSTARKELDHEKTKMRMTLHDMAEQLRATYGG